MGSLDRVGAASLLVLLLVPCAVSFYLPGVAPRDFHTVCFYLASSLSLSVGFGSWKAESSRGFSSLFLCFLLRSAV